MTGRGGSEKPNKDEQGQPSLQMRETQQKKWTERSESVKKETRESLSCPERIAQREKSNEIYELMGRQEEGTRTSRNMCKRKHSVMKSTIY